MRPGDDRAEADVPFATSGQSGAPVVWLRSVAQLRAEAAVVADAVVGDVDRVVSYAPPRHLYGRVFGEALPRHLGVPVQALWESPFTPPDLAPGSRTLVVCLPSTWELLDRIVDRLRTATVVAVHSTAPLPPSAHRVIAALAGSAFRAVEILGSTETGAVAHRTLAPRPALPALWTLFPDCSLVRTVGPGDEQPLRVAGPRLARIREAAVPPAALTLDDLVRPVGERSFELLGRASRMIKINGRRVDLAEVERAVCEAFPRTDIVCVPRRDRLRAEHYDLYYAQGPVEVRPAEVRDVLAAAFPGVPAPRAVRRVPEIPRSVAGKVRVDRLPAIGESGPPPRRAPGGAGGRAH
ncbi:acyl-CoA synthetase [Streptomyces sp. PT12]|uniref:acyl-CoA synthetase n=1 Tax=Streptomyces sp. PT12 TaxID=1510197 RepID=UPI000DFB5DC5|nr:acyl-CoA synthetase [Streptomyces sp. PT12]RBM19450.1 acyl-CoA synthetase [Streptomyces sp. PT12]